MIDAVLREVKVVQVIKVTAARGDGKSTIMREVVQFWDFDGNLLAENDSYVGGKDTVEGFVDRGIVVRSGERPPPSYVPTGTIPEEQRPKSFESVEDHYHKLFVDGRPTHLGRHPWEGPFR